VVLHLFTKKTWLIFLLVLGALLLGGKLFFFKSVPHKMPDAKLVETEVAAISKIQETTRFIGTIRAQKSTLLVIKAKGVLDILVTPGKLVKKGELIGKIRSQDVDTSSKLSEDSVSIAKIQYERALQLLKKGVMSKNAVEEKKALLIEAQKRLSDAHFQLEQTNIEAPFAGSVGFFKIKDGSQVQEGDVLVTLYDPSSLMVEFDVPLAVVKTIRDKAAVRVNNQVYPLTYIQRMLDEDTHMCPAYVNIECEQCIIGTTTPLDVVLAEKQGVIVVQYEAIFLRDSKPYVYVVKDNRASLTPVTLGLREKERVEITKGIAQGDRIILRGQSRLYPNAPIRVATNTENVTKNVTESVKK
jgi:membrane fusion protein (multidrug efflux system)